jgi:hypothetical protein
VLNNTSGGSPRAGDDRLVSIPSLEIHQLPTPYNPPRASILPRIAIKLIANQIPNVAVHTKWPGIDVYTTAECVYRIAFALH